MIVFKYCKQCSQLWKVKSRVSMRKNVENPPPRQLRPWSRLTLAPAISLEQRALSLSVAAPFRGGNYSAIKSTPILDFKMRAKKILDVSFLPCKEERSRTSTFGSAYGFLGSDSQRLSLTLCLVSFYFSVFFSFSRIKLRCYACFRQHQVAEASTQHPGTSAACFAVAPENRAA